jgi:hypothetical protein
MRIHLAVIALCAAAPPTARAGVTLTIENQDKTQTVMVLDGNKMRSEDSRGGGVISIFDGDARKMIHVMVSQKSYMEMTEADMKAMRAQVEAILAQAPPEQRARMEAGMGGKPGAKAARPATKYERMGKTETVAGHRCEWYREHAEGQVKSEACYVPWGPDTLTREDLRPMKKMSEFMEAFMPGESTLQEELDAAPGFPAVHVDMQGDKRETQRLVSIKRGSVGADTFRPPAGFAKAKNPM